MGDKPQRGAGPHSDDLRRALLRPSARKFRGSPSSFGQYVPPELGASYSKGHAGHLGQGAPQSGDSSDYEDYGSMDDSDDHDHEVDRVVVPETEQLVPQGGPVRAVEPRQGGMMPRMRRAVGKWAVMRSAPRELWVVYLMKFLSSYSYFSFSLVMTLFLTEEYGLSDQNAGWCYGLYGVMSTIWGVGCGWLIDWLGVRRSLVVGAAVGTVTRLALAFSFSTTWTIILLATALPFAEALGIPIMTIAIKRYTNASTKTYAFSFFYSVMNVAALVAGPLVDGFRSIFKSGVTIAGMELSALRLVLVSSAVSTGLMVFVVLVGIREIELDEEGNVAVFQPGKQDPWTQTKKVLRERNFWKLVLFTFLLMGVRLVFRHMDATLPKYMTREFGEDAPFGLFYAINPLMIIVLVPIVGLLTKETDSFTMILYGSFVSGLSPFWVCIGNYYWAVAMFLVTLSLGEAVYSPRVYEYTMDIAGSGEEGVYTSLSSAPLFMVKLVVGGMSGWLLTQFCPEDGPRNSAAMWGIIGATSFVSPVLMLVLQDAIKPEGSSNSKSGAPSFGTAAIGRNTTGTNSTSVIPSTPRSSRPIEMFE